MSKPKGSRGLGRKGLVKANPGVAALGVRNTWGATSGYSLLLLEALWIA